MDNDTAACIHSNLFRPADKYDYQRCEANYEKMLLER